MEEKEDWIDALYMDFIVWGGGTQEEFRKAIESHIPKDCVCGEKILKHWKCCPNCRNEIGQVY